MCVCVCVCVCVCSCSFPYDNTDLGNEETLHSIYHGVKNENKTIQRT